MSQEENNKITTIKIITFNNLEIYELPRPIKITKPVDRRKVIKALIEAWEEDYEKLNKEIKEERGTKWKVKKH